MLDIMVKYLYEGARDAEGLTVIVDILRAGTVIATALHRCIEYIVPCIELQQAYGLQNDGYLIAGEIDGQKPNGFNYGNSPAALLKENLTGRKLALTTMAGTRGIVAAKGADEILIGGFINNSAIEDYIKKANPKTVTIVAMGYRDTKETKRAPEDDEYAFFLRDRLLGKSPDVQEIIRRILKDESTQRYRDPGNHIFPRADLFHSLTYDKYKVVPRVSREGDLLVIRNALNNQDSS
jgi:2-phosphosulfolactate phosphatase